MIRWASHYCVSLPLGQGGHLLSLRARSGFPGDFRTRKRYSARKSETLSTLQTLIW